MSTFTQLTPDQRTAELIGAALDDRIHNLLDERAALVNGPQRIAEIDATIAVLQTEKARIDPRRPVLSSISRGTVDIAAGTPVDSAP